MSVFRGKGELEYVLQHCVNGSESAMPEKGGGVN